MPKSSMIAVLCLLASASAMASSYLPSTGGDRDRIVDCLDDQVSRQLPSSLGVVQSSDPLESISASDPSVINFHFYTRLPSGAHQGWYLKLKLASGAWRYINAGNGTVSEYSPSATLPSAAFVTEDSGAQGAKIDVAGCARFWSN